MPPSVCPNAVPASCQAQTPSPRAFSVRRPRGEILLGFRGSETGRSNTMFDRPVLGRGIRLFGDLKPATKDCHR